MTQHLRLVLVAIIMASAVSIMSTDLYTPSLPHLPEVFETSAQSVKLTISLNLLAFGLATLLVGPISDRYGRRPTLLIGLLAFTGFSAACAVAQSIGQLIAFRVFQGLSASVEAVVGLAIIKDLFDDTSQVKALAIWGMAIAIAPALAPILGGYVHVALGWRANFWIVVGAGAIACTLIWFVLPESSRRDPNALKPRQLLTTYAALLTNRDYVRYVMLLSTSLGVIFAFITAGPFILIERHGIRTEHYGYYQAAIVAAFFIGSLLSNQLAGRVPLGRLLAVGAVLCVTGALALPAAYMLGALTPLSLTFCVSVCALGMGPVFAVAPSLALQVAGSRTGAASALLNAGQMLIGGAGSALVSALHDGTSRPFIVTVIVLLILAGCTWLFARPQAHRKHT